MKHYNIQYYVALIISAFLLMAPAIFNGYPLVNSDSSTYIESGFIPDAPWDRPITYGLLLYAFSLGGVSMWLAIFMQGYIVSWLISRFIVHFSSRKNIPVYTLVTVLVLSVTTGASWVVSELIADIYTPIAIMCLLLLLTSEEKKTNRIIHYSLFFIAVATHVSHLIMFSITLILLLVLRNYFSKRENKKKYTASILIMLLLTVSTVGIMGAAMSKSKHVFFMASLLDKGVLKMILDDNCATNNYTLCKYKDNLPEDPNQFMWGENSPMQKEGGWKATQKEYNEIISHLYSNGRYIAEYIKTSLLFTTEQLGSFKTGDGNTPFPAGSNVHQTIQQYIPHEAKDFVSAKQNRRNIREELFIPNMVIYLTVVISLAVLIITFRNKKQSYHLKTAIAICILCLIINAWDCATFSMVNGRYGCRVMWLLPLFAMVTMLRKRNNHYSNLFNS